MKQTIAEQLSDYVANTDYRHFSKESIRKAKLCLMDSLGCMVGGAITEMGRVLLRYHERFDDLGNCTVIGSKKNGSATHATFLNALLSNALDFDDTYLNSFHLGATIVPPALSLAEIISVSGKELLESILLGYEVSGRIGISLNPYLSRKKLYGYGTWQSLGAVIVVGKLLNLNSQQLANAIGIAGCNAPVPSVMKTVFNPLGPNMVKNNYGAASEVGVRAAFLATEAFTGPINLFEGKTGFWQMCGASGCDLKNITKRLDRGGYEILGVGFKSYPVCWLLQSAIEAAIFIMKTHDLAGEDVEKVTVKTSQLVCKWPFNNREPKATVEAQFSLPYSVSAAIMGVPVGPEWFFEKNLSSHTILALAKKVEILPDEGGEGPVISYPATVEIQTKRESYSKSVKFPKGHPHNPFSEKDVERKFLELSTPRLGEKKAKSAIEAIKHLENLNDIRVLMKLFRFRAK